MQNGGQPPAVVTLIWCMFCRRPKRRAPNDIICASCDHSALCSNCRSIEPPLRNDGKFSTFCPPTCAACNADVERARLRQFVTEKFLREDDPEDVVPILDRISWVQGVYSATAIARKMAYAELKRPLLKET